MQMQISIMTIPWTSPIHHLHTPQQFECNQTKRKKWVRIRIQARHFKSRTHKKEKNKGMKQWSSKKFHTDYTVQFLVMYVRAFLVITYLIWFTVNTLYFITLLSHDHHFRILNNPCNIITFTPSISQHSSLNSAITCAELNIFIIFNSSTPYPSFASKHNNSNSTLQARKEK